jgi:hypothetical protein
VDPEPVSATFEKKKLLSLPGIEPLNLSHSALSLVIVLTELFRILFGKI